MIFYQVTSSNNKVLLLDNFNQNIHQLTEPFGLGSINFRHFRQRQHQWAVSRLSGEKVPCFMVECVVGGLVMYHILVLLLLVGL